MQRIAILLIVGLICMIGLGTTIQAKSTPDGYINPAIRGDDHTWGGEQGVGDDIDNGDDRPQIGIMPWTFGITHVLYEHLFIIADEVMHMTGFIIPTEEGSDRGQTTSGIISTCKGN
ncbi:MAG: hypothetical protein ABIE70_05210 [bacterium]